MLWAIPLMLSAALVWPFGNNDKDGKKKPDTSEFEKALLAAVVPGVSHGVVVQHGIPAAAAWEIGLVKVSKQYTLDVANGMWHTTFESNTGFWDDSLGWTEVVKVDNVHVKDKHAEIRVLSLAERMVPGGLLGSDKPGVVATNFRIVLPDNPAADDVPAVLRNLDGLVRLFRTEAEATDHSEALRAGRTTELSAPAARPTLVQPGMREPEVRDMMGTPQSERRKGQRMIWIYPGEEVIFEKGKVTEVHLR